MTMNAMDWVLAVVFVTLGTLALQWAGMRRLPAIATASGLMAAMLAFVAVYPS